MSDELLLFLPIEIDKEIWPLIDAHAVQAGLLQLWLQTLPDGNGDVFSSWNFREKLGDLFVEEAVVHRVKDFAVHHFLELFEVDDEARAWIDFAFHRNFERVVVAVAMRVIAFSEQAEVLFSGERRVVVVVRGGKLGFAGEINHACVRSLRRTPGDQFAAGH